MHFKFKTTELQCTYLAWCRFWYQHCLLEHMCRDIESCRGTHRLVAFKKNKQNYNVYIHVALKLYTLAGFALTYRA
jgi:hypothetical protein